MKNAVPAARASSGLVTNVRTAVLVGCAVVVGVMLSSMVLGSGPPVPAESAPATDPAPSAPETLQGDATLDVAPVDVGADASLPTSAPLVSPLDTSSETVPAPDPESPIALFTPTSVVAPDPPQSLPSVERPRVPTPPAVPPSAVVSPAVAAPETEVTSTSPPRNPVPASTSPPGVSPSTASVPPPAAAVTTDGSQSFVVDDVAQITLESSGGTLAVSSVTTTSPEWVYEIDKNGPHSVEIKFFNLVSEREAEFHAEFDGGRIKVESEG